MNEMQSKTLSLCFLFLFAVLVIISFDKQPYGIRKHRRIQLVFDPKTITLKTDSHKSGEATLGNNKGDKARIEIDKKAALFPDIVSISHIASAAAIKIQLNKNRNCFKPVFRSRLSGPALAIVKWEEIDLKKHELIGHYNVPYSGKYFFEIVAIFCNELEFDQDFKDTCLVDIFHHRVTAKISTIDVVQINKQHEEIEDKGSWVHASAHQDEQYIPLHTRIQPDMCTGLRAKALNVHRRFRNIPPIIISPLSDRERKQCDEYGDIRPFESYHFQWNEGIKKELLQHNGTEMKICFVGASHSQHFARAVQQLRGESESSGNIFARFQHQVTESLWDEILNEKKCRRIVFGFGQWSASFSGQRPVLFPAYQNATKSLIIDIISKRERLKLHGADVFFRSMHFLPLNNLVASSCPPVDWRSPPVVDRYNIIERKLCMEHGIPFIDTNFLTSPVWDSSPDWMHLNMPVKLVESQYVIAQTSILATNSIVK